MRRVNPYSLKKSLILSLFLILLLMPKYFEKIAAIEMESGSLSSGDTLKFEDTLTVPPLADTQSTGRKVSNLSFGTGEKLEFKVRWGPIVAGSATMEIAEIIEFKGRECHRIISTAESNKFFSTFFKVRDRVESFMDKKGIYSLHFEKHIREGKFKADRYVDFDQENHLAVEGKDTIQVPPFVQDVLSALYYVRTQPLVVGNSLFVDNHTDKKNYPIEVKVLRKERIEVEAGTFDCLVVEPILQASAIFEQKGSLTVWLTDDQKKMPVLMKSKVVIGSIATELKNYRLGRVGE